MRRVLFVLLASVLPGVLPAEWQLAPEASALSFVTVRDGTAMEAHRFNDLRGQANESGHAELQVQLASVDTGDGQRDQRLEDLFFEVGRFARATYAVDFRLTDVTQALQPGESATYELDGVLHWRGVARRLPASVTVTRLPGDAFQISSREPVLVSIADFDAIGGLEQLRKVAALNSIAPAAAVSFSLVYRKVDF
jgi:polyisoprenoid-binding protein YceI